MEFCRYHKQTEAYSHQLCALCYSKAVTYLDDNGALQIFYAPQPHQVEWHEHPAPNLLALGTRGTGKSKMIRMDAIMRCLLIPNFKALIIRRKIPDLRKSHLNFIAQEMKKLGGVFLWTTMEAKFPNGSKIQFTHCERTADVMDFLSSEWGAIYFDELSTFTLEQFLLISAAARTTIDEPYVAVVRAGSNPMGIGAQWMKIWFVDKTVNLIDFPDYHPDDFVFQFSTLEDNLYIDKKTYEARLKNLPDHVRRAWLKGEFVIEGAYFTDFLPSKLVLRDGEEVEEEWHVIKQMPKIRDNDGLMVSILNCDWIHVYRAIDWGYWPDPAVCLWIAVLPNSQAIVFKERTWKKTLAADVAKAIKRESRGMRVLETFCDPTMFVKTGTIKYSIGELFEQNGVPLTAAQNDRELFGYSVHNYLNTTVNDGQQLLPQLQILQDMGPLGCRELVRTLPILQMDEDNPAAVADGEDHWGVALGYFCMGQATPSHNKSNPMIPRWMLPKRAGVGPMVNPLVVQ